MINTRNLSLVTAALIAVSTAGCVKEGAQRTDTAPAPVATTSHAAPNPPVATATGSAAGGPTDTMSFPASMGTVNFPHKLHQDLLKDCGKCHEKSPGKIQGFGKDWAHAKCKGCHQEMGKGPTGCTGCHKK